MRKNVIWILLIAVAGLTYWGLPSFSQIRQSYQLTKYFNNGSVAIRPYAVLQWDTSKTRWTVMDTTASLGVNTTWVTFMIADTAGKSTGTYNIGRLDTLTNYSGSPWYIYVENKTAASNDTVHIFGAVVDKPFVDRSDSTVAIDTLNLTAGIHMYRSPKIWAKIDSVRIWTGGAGTDSIILWRRPYWAAKMADSLETEILGVSVSANRYYNLTTVAADTVTTGGWGYAVVRGEAQVYGYSDGKGRYIYPGHILVTGKSGKVMRPNRTLTGTDTTSIKNYVQRNEHTFMVGRSLMLMDSTNFISADSTLMWIDVGKD